MKVPGAFYIRGLLVRWQNVRFITGRLQVRVLYNPFTRQGFSNLKKKGSGNMNSFISWIGGKKLLRKQIIEQFPDYYERYVEVFGGAGWVLFRKEQKGMEVYNDVNGELVNLFRCVKYHPEALQKELDGILMSRELFFDAVAERRGMTDIQRAARQFIVIKESFGSSLDSFGVRPRNMKKAVDFIQVASGRLTTVVIENLDFEHLIKTYDRPGTLFYLDPPYYDAEKYYPDRFMSADHERLWDTLERIKGKFILSYNDCEAIREMYRGYHILPVERQNNLTTKGSSGKYKELLIRNY